jgi:hypothetical protein
MRKLLLSAILVIFAGLAIPDWGLTQESQNLFFAPTLGNLKFSVSYDTMLYPDRPVSGQTADMGFSQHRVRLFAPIAQSERFEWAALGGLKALAFDTGAVLPDSRQGFPDQLWDVDFGTAARWKLDNGWIVGADVVVGSASDRPFASIDETSFEADALLSVPWRQSFTWIFLLNYSNNREFAPHVPLPGVTLAYEPGPHLQLVAGLPYNSIRWVPVSGLEISASYFILRTVRSRVSYRILSPLTAYAGFDWDSQRFFRHDRTDDDARLSYYEKRIGGGVRWDVTPNVYLDAGGGYAFDRFWFEGESYSDRNINRIDLADGPFATFKIGVRF